MMKNCICTERAMPKNNDWEKILAELPPPDPDLPELDELDEESIEAERKHQIELDRIIANDKITTDDPGFEQRASHRRSAVYALTKRKAAIGAEPDGGEFFPPSDLEYVPAPKGATGFAVQVTKHRRPKRGLLSSTTSGYSVGHTSAASPRMATIWDGKKTLSFEILAKPFVLASD